jgi:hypothetical protein
MKRITINAMLALALLQFAPWPALSHSASGKAKAWTWNRQLNAQSEKRKLDLQIAPAAQSTRLKIEADVQAGRLEWKLRDPRGEVRASGFAVAGQISGVADSGQLEPLPGQWKLELKAKKMSGGYRILWVQPLM